MAPYTYTREIPVNAKLFWAAVLRRAVFDYVLYKGVGKRKLEWQKAAQYVFTKGLRYEQGLSFEEVCELFGWEPDYIRRLTTKLDKSDIKRMETSSFKEELTQDALASAVKKAGSWKTSNFALPFYPRMLDEFTFIGEVKVIRRETLARRVPMVQWQATA